ncbi:MAG: 23S rRNA (cytosine(1962)-C(5))-methyltransferase RlmI [Candidatus Dactylopiibacterium carminicum]|uniref:23S rRNA (Cytosine(1962)-C(5))-methyltransferase RlmI n=1 Tax=Candidatus Dactylopiibacterium carminicum TaxID=857335 RepID=A0A272EX64_9RHOO|nr:class I SAM-dependent methyltransferase [Candidatus Dactylopiibacterium carminicum]KAF7599593.1 23S rRNA (cytosine(1962)-C(5))-methyltransferase RlmI [Candidatus Dactylopiibacterium carminicum]PAS94240.1 MAG: 23S rRNA (cytosine(1962)-C(5))-methyltransferase RlmI [Candidatus Dactylopiibacterium carminicum]PAS98437.1 MAG: 23S rRNA (cytosine(1962)-C(5))-methyltransferase RlmI [Candidatus Dactylopiibacterium carminicum]PAS99595.1 MAG: 23S rRNA methyltransferase [Candidatus Dactylopiibacterium ca
MAELTLAPGKERSVMRRHPWIFAGSVAKVAGRSRPGDTVEVYNDRGQFMGRAAYSPDSQIRARMWSFDAEESIDHGFFKRRIAACVARRTAHPHLARQDGLRLIHGESDGLPGIIADRFGAVVVLQLTSAGGEKWRDAIVAGLVQATGCLCVYERSDSDVRRLEGLEPRSGILHGELPASVTITENGVKMEVDVVAGHKTGFYLDQRDNRLLTGQLSAGRAVLNCFCYTGGFSLQALAGGASSVLSIDSSGPALATAQRNLTLNPQLDASRAEWWEADVFEALRKLRAEGRSFDLIVLDPPKFAPSAAHAQRAARAYKDINILGFRLLNPGGILMTYSCSGGIGQELFQQIVAGAAVDAGVDARILHRLAAGADHPIGLAVPEGEYLKGLACQIG